MKKFIFFMALIGSGMITASSVVADDLDIFGGQLIDVKPNVLIVFDNSGSMDWCIDGSDPDDWNATCNSSTNRMSIAKAAVKSLIDRVDSVNFGLMAFNQGSGVYGGEILADCGTTEATVKNQIDALSPNGFTPLGETVAEAGLYFAGADSWFNGSTLYNSPIAERCQKNYILLMTDGEPTSDDHSNLCNSSYLNAVDTNGNLTGDSIGDYDNDKSSGCSDEADADDYLDDVTKYLYDNDILPDWGAAPYEIQNIKTYVIGFTVDVDILNDAAANGGTVSSLSANDTTALNAAFNQILNEIQETNAIYVAPVIPPKSENVSEVGDRAYMAFFKPQADGRWRGNLKGYKLVNGILYDADDEIATITSGAEEGYLKTDARSLWTPAGVNDGREVDQGGAGALLAARDPLSRNIYTYLWQENVHDLTDASKKNVFAKDNTSTYFNGALGVANDTERDALIDLVLDVDWPLGDIVHSEPLVEVYHDDANSNNVVDAGELKPYIFVGANDGMLHAFDGSDGSEAWGFVPPGQLTRLERLQADNVHDYFVDGSPVMAEIDTTDTKKVLFFGERRGGDRYYALDLDDPVAPEWFYQVYNSALSGIDWDEDGNDDGAAATLGQSWATPQIKAVRSDGVLEKVFLLTGGYDENQDADTPAATDSVGRAIYAVKVEDGTVTGLNLNGALWSEMTHSIVDVTAFSAKGRRYIDRVYAGDLGGKLLAAKYNEVNDNNGDTDDTDDWDKFVLLNLPGQYSVGGVSKTLGRKFMNKPEVTLEPEGECIYAGTGDSEDPLGKGVVDAFYVACNQWEVDGTSYVDVAGLIDPVMDISIDPTGLPATPLPGDLPDDPFTIVAEKLVDVTSDKIQNGTALEQAIVQKALDIGSGWFIRMEHDGEKITSSPQILNGRIFFTTFAPEGNTGDDVCAASNDLGTSRLYMLDYQTGMAAYDLNDDDEKTKDERSVVIGTSIAYDPVLITSGGKTTLLYGAGGRLQAREVETRDIIRKYYWRQVK